MKVGLPRSAPEQHGVPSSAILRLLSRLEEQEIHGFMLLRKGHVLAEGHWAPFSPSDVHQLFSLSKSFTSAAIGFLTDERKLSLDDRVVSFFPELLPNVVSENLAQMRVRDLLMMASGHETEPFSSASFDPQNLVRSFLHHPVTKRPGSHFLYNSLATTMCSAILTKVTGESLTQFLHPRLFAPLGIERHDWDKDASGLEVGGWGLNIRLEDVAKFGQLLLDGGIWQGKRLLPEAWLAQATSRQIENGARDTSDWSQGYGFQFWRNRPSGFRGDGAFGQYCLVLPEHELVVAINSAVDDMQAVMTAVWEEILPNARPSLRSASATHAKLRAKLKSLQLPVLVGRAEANPAIAGRYDVVGETGTTLEVTLAEQNVHLEWSGTRKTNLVAGFGTWTTATFEEMPVAACAAWTPAGLEIKVRWLQRTQGETWLVKASARSLNVDRKVRCILFEPGNLGFQAIRK